jgi:Zn-dependent protease with chaperone function
MQEKSDMKEESDKVKLIFAELQAKELILGKRKIKSSRFVQNFKAGILFYNTIFYNPAFSQIEENNLRFCLLHEEGHKVKHQYGLPGIFFFFILAMIPVIFNWSFSSNNPTTSISTTIYSLMFILISVKIFNEPLRRDELESDLFAATILRDSYGIKKPSNILYNALTEVQTILASKLPVKVSISEKIMVGLVSYHPSIEERVKNVRIFVDRN